MEFEWDLDKSDATYVLRGFDFGLAAEIFAGPIIKTVDSRRDYGEVRVHAIGKAAGMTLVVICTDRDNSRRIISARLASRKERLQWLNLFA